jgi:hypothetical protein
MFVILLQNKFIPQYNFIDALLHPSITNYNLKLNLHNQYSILLIYY